MAISTTYNKKQEELARQQAPVTSNKTYNGLHFVSSNTANNLGNYQQGYRQSDQAQAAQQQLQQIQAQKPQGYSSKYAPAMQNILEQIQNPKEFKYEFNGDNLFKYYADLYTQKGKQASMDAMGQAAALTGGYGNSYGQQVGQQGYQQYLLNLYDRGMDLRDRAYQQHQDQIGDQYNQYNALAGAEDRDYGQYRDTVGDWQNELNFAANRADTERDFDYGQYQNELNYWTGLAQIENADYRTEQERQEAIRQYEQNFAENQRQFDEQMKQSADQFAATDKLNWAKLEQDQAQFDANLDETQRQYNRNVAIDYVTSILANGQIPSNELLVAAGLSLEDAKKLIAQVTGKGTGKKKGTGDTNGVQGNSVQPEGYGLQNGTVGVSGATDRPNGQYATGSVATQAHTAGSGTATAGSYAAALTGGTRNGLTKTKTNYSVDTGAKALEQLLRKQMQTTNK